MQMRFRDRLYNRKVGRAMTSPLGIVLAGAGAAAGLALGLPIVVAVGIGAAAWAGRVAVAMPRGVDFDGIDPFELADPWRSYVWRAKRAKKLYAEAVKSAREGPLQSRLDDLGNHIGEGVWECWRIAKSGQLLTQARAQINDGAITQQLTQLNWTNGGPPSAGSSKAQTVAALESQLATGKRLDTVIADTSDQLQLLNSRLDEAVTRAIELAARGQRVDDLGSVVSDVHSVVSDMEALRLALDETDRSTSSSSMPIPDLSSLPTPSVPTTPAETPASPTPPAQQALPQTPADTGPAAPVASPQAEPASHPQQARPPAAPGQQSPA